jgi:hypothetical protein
MLVTVSTPSALKIRALAHLARATDAGSKLSVGLAARKAPASTAAYGKSRRRHDQRLDRFGFVLKKGAIHAAESVPMCQPMRQFVDERDQLLVGT